MKTSNKPPRLFLLSFKQKKMFPYAQKSSPVIKFLKVLNKQKKYSYKSQELEVVWTFITAWNGRPTTRHIDKWNTLSIHLFNGTLVSWICHAHQNTESHLGIS